MLFLQVATDARLWLRSEIGLLATKLSIFVKAFTKRAESEVDALMPGYTHLQRAQPIRFFIAMCHIFVHV